MVCVSHASPPQARVISFGFHCVDSIGTRCLPEGLGAGKPQLTDREAEILLAKAALGLLGNHRSVYGLLPGQD